MKTSLHPLLRMVFLRTQSAVKLCDSTSVITRHVSTTPTLRTFQSFTSPNRYLAVQIKTSIFEWIGLHLIYMTLSVPSDLDILHDFIFEKNPGSCFYLFG